MLAGNLVLSKIDMLASSFVSQQIFCCAMNSATSYQRQEKKLLPLGVSVQTLCPCFLSGMSCKKEISHLIL